MTLWILVHRSAVAADAVIGAKLIGFFASATDADRAAAQLVEEFDDHRATPDGFERFELTLDREIPTELSNRIISGR